MNVVVKKTLSIRDNNTTIDCLSKYYKNEADCIFYNDGVYDRKGNASLKKSSIMEKSFRAATTYCKTQNPQQSLFALSYKMYDEINACMMPCFPLHMLCNMIIEGM